MDVIVSLESICFNLGVKKFAKWLTFCVSIFLGTLLSTPSRAEVQCHRATTTQRELPSERFQNSSAESQKFWRSYSAHFKEETLKIIRASHKEFLAAKSIDDPYVMFLESLGFKITEEVIIVPSLLRIMDRLESQILEKINSGEILEADALWPIMNLVVQDQNGNIIPNLRVRAGADLPAGQIFTEISASRGKTDLLSGIDFAEMNANGFFPIGALFQVIGGRTSEFLHDLAHMSAMINDPKYMTAVKRSYKRLRNNFNSRHELAAALNPDGNLSQTKIFLALESLIVTNQKRASEIPAYLGIETLLLRKKNPSRFEIEEYFENLKQHEVDAIIERIINESSRYFISVGASKRDLVSHLAFGDSRFPVDYLLNKLRSPTKGRLARFVKFVLNTKDFSAAEWASHLISNHQSQNPLWLELARDGEVFTSHNESEVFFLDAFN